MKNPTLLKLAIKHKNLPHIDGSYHNDVIVTIEDKLYDNKVVCYLNSGPILIPLDDIELTTSDSTWGQLAAFYTFYVAKKRGLEYVYTPALDWALLDGVTGCGDFFDGARELTPDQWLHIVGMIALADEKGLEQSFL